MIKIYIKQLTESKKSKKIELLVEKNFNLNKFEKRFYDFCKTN